jgi:HPt (histidine-containing phosphotransfer) domain-containing protein
MDAPLDTGTLQSLRLIPGPDGKPLLEHVIRLALTSLPEAVEKLNRSLTEGDWEALRRTAHTLKGTGGSFGAKVLSEHAKALEGAAQEPGAPRAATCLAAVRAEADRVMEALKALQSS